MKQLKELKEIEVKTDCGVITVQEYDDEIASGVKIFLDDTIVAMVDCYRKESTTIKASLPTEEFIDADNEENEKYLSQVSARDMSDIISDYLADKYGFCVFSFQFYMENDSVGIVNIKWDVSEEEDKIPEARLLIYGPEGAEFDEPQQCITIN